MEEPWPEGRGSFWDTTFLALQGHGSLGRFFVNL